MTAPPPVETPTARVPSYPVLLGCVFAVCTVGMTANLLGAIALGVVDEGPRTLEQQLAGVAGFGVGGLVVCLAAAWWCSRTTVRSRVGAVVLGLAAVPALVLFFAGVPGMLGVTAAYLAGLTRGGAPLGGVPRAFGLVGLVLAVLNVVAHVVLISAAWIAELV